MIGGAASQIPLLYAGGVPIEAYKQYAAIRSDRPSSVADYPSSVVTPWRDGGRAAEDGKATWQMTV